MDIVLPYDSISGPSNRAWVCEKRISGHQWPFACQSRPSSRICQSLIFSLILIIILGGWRDLAGACVEVQGYAAAPDSRAENMSTIVSSAKH